MAQEITRLRLWVIAATLLVGAIAGASLWVLNERAAERTQAVRGEGEAQVGGPFSLVDQNGARRTEADFRGKYMLVFFGFTHCPDVCPTTLAVISDALDRLGAAGRNIIPIFITVDPERDTPEAMKSYLESFGPRFVGLTGSQEEIANVARAYRVYYAKRPFEGGYAVDHSSVIYLMGRDGKFLANYALELGPEAIAADIRKKV
ncbi:MAG: SCO family protein [Alphaproteobacteria bacterium]